MGNIVGIMGETVQALPGRALPSSIAFVVWHAPAVFLLSADGKHENVHVSITL